MAGIQEYGYQSGHYGLRIANAGLPERSPMHPESRIQEMVSQAQESIVLIDHVPASGFNEQGEPVDINTPGYRANAFVISDASGNRFLSTAQHNLQRRVGRYEAIMIDPETKERYESGGFRQIGPDSAATYGSYIGRRPGFEVVEWRMGDLIVVLGGRHVGNDEYDVFPYLTGVIDGSKVAKDGNTYLTSTVELINRVSAGDSGSPVLLVNPHAGTLQTVGHLRYADSRGTVISPMSPNFSRMQ